MNKLIVAPAPHVHSGDSVRKNMLNVIIALIPAYLVSLYFFGLGAFIVSATAVVSCVVFEYLIQRFICKQKTSIGDLSAVLTGMLLGFNLPSNLPVWMVVVGALVAIGVAKMSFGGLGNNLFNPALVGRVFLLISFPAPMTTWPKPTPLTMSYLDAQTAATPLTLMKEKGVEALPTLWEMFIGHMGGSLGEVSALALLIGGIYLIATKTISWHIPVSILLTVFVFSGILWLANGEVYANPMIHLLSGGLMLGAIFMATDYVTSPMSPLGQIVYGIGIGIITIVIRVFGSYPEGMSFAILIMNAATPLINMYIHPKRFGENKK
ncbi:MAG: RnfABCDGE type electron transport complex subunit D [Bacteroidetes bacterium]|uniref:Ion-translocating oxidoreductase complex subunit D n=1 Tax=Candidatus Gallipaludibacter merdavium TaxID=2840839 RepID=A0A9D9N3T1_9BACT|nr:RnfABCDGE type electron transport complex subunit D [Candidatus Gallipaludibacter merdavium]